MKTLNIARPVEPQDLTKFPLDLAAWDDGIFFSDANELLFSEPAAEAESDSFQPLDDDDVAKNSSSENDADEQVIARRPKEASRRRVYRRLQKIERENLRGQESELTKELTQLQRNRAGNRGASRTPTYLFWKSLALQRKEKRVLAEARQRELIDAVGAQARYINALSGTLGDRQGQDTTESDTSRAEESQ